MEIFVDSSQASTLLLELVISYLQLQEKGKVRLIRMSKGALKAKEMGRLRVQVPSMVLGNGEVVHETWEIVRELVGLTPQWVGFLLGSEADESEQIRSIGSLIKDGKELRKSLNRFFESRTFCVSNHLTIADFIIFFAMYNNANDMSDEQKLQYSHIVRWYRHIQNLPQITAFLAAKNMLFLQLPLSSPAFLPDKKPKNPKPDNHPTPASHPKTQNKSQDQQDKDKESKSKLDSNCNQQKNNDKIQKLQLKINSLISENQKSEEDADSLIKAEKEKKEELTIKRVSSIEYKEFQ